MACLGLDMFWTLAHISTQESHSPCLGPHFNRQLSSPALNPKWRAIIHHKVCCKIVGFEVPNSPHSKSLSSSASVSSWAASGLFPLPCSTTSCRRLALKTSLESLKLSPSIIFTFEPLLFKEHWRLHWKDVKLPGSYSVPSNLFKLLKNLHNSKFSSSSGMSDSSLFSFSCKQNRFTLRFAGFCCKTNSWNSSTFLFSLLSFSLTHSVSCFPIPSIQRPQEIFNCHGKDFPADKLWNRILMSRLQKNFSCGTKRVIPSRQDHSSLPARVANHSTEFGSYCLHKIAKTFDLKFLSLSTIPLT